MNEDAYTIRGNRIAFQIRGMRDRKRWQVEYLARATDPDVIAGMNTPGWHPLITGFETKAEAIERLRSGWRDVQMHPVSLDGTFAPFDR